MRCRTLDLSRYVTTDTEQQITSPKEFLSSGLSMIHSFDNSFGMIWKNNNREEIGRITHFGGDLTDGTIAIVGKSNGKNVYDKSAKNNALMIDDEIRFNSYPIIHAGNLSQYINASAIKAQAATLETKENVNVSSYNNEDMQLTENQIQKSGGVISEFHLPGSPYLVTVREKGVPHEVQDIGLGKHFYRKGNIEICIQYRRCLSIEEQQCFGKVLRVSNHRRKSSERLGNGYRNVYGLRQRHSICYPFQNRTGYHVKEKGWQIPLLENNPADLASRKEVVGYAL